MTRKKMLKSESYVFLKNVRFHAFHGVMPQERQVGGDFLLSLRVGYPMDKAMESDDVADTLNYHPVAAVGTCGRSHCESHHDRFP